MCSETECGVFQAQVADEGEACEFKSATGSGSEVGRRCG